MNIAYVRWADASYSNRNDEREIGELHGTVELHAVGFLLNEDDPETVTLTMEHQDGATTSRIWQIIPRVNILEMRVRSVDTALPKRRKKSA